MAGRDSYEIGSAKKRVGDQGEERFRRILDLSEISTHYFTDYTLSLPTTPSYRKQMNGDVDAAVANARNLLLLDVKDWTDEYLAIAKREPLSQNMLMAHERYSEALPGIDVRVMIIFVRSDGGEVTPVHGIDELEVPGGFPVYRVEDGLTEIYRLLGVPERPDLSTVRLLEQMKRAA